MGILIFLYSIPLHLCSTLKCKKSVFLSEDILFTQNHLFPSTLNRRHVSAFKFVHLVDFLYWLSWKHVFPIIKIPLQSTPSLYLPGLSLRLYLSPYPSIKYISLSLPLPPSLSLSLSLSLSTHKNTLTLDLEHCLIHEHLTKKKSRQNKTFLFQNK